jgi:membrane associated rhomboid family serine protease
MTLGGSPFSDVSWHMRQLGRSPVCWVWVAVVLGIQVAVTLAGGYEVASVKQVFYTLGLSRAGMLHGYVWQLVTYGFLHGGWLHAGLNTLFLLVLGSRIEHMVSGAMVSKALILGILGGGVFHLLFSPANAKVSWPLVGASGGCVALLLLLTTLSPGSRMMPLPISGRSLGNGVLLAELLLALVHPGLGLPGFSRAGVWLVQHGMENWFQLGHACHLGGGLVGWFLGRWVLRPRVSLQRLRRDRERREAHKVPKSDSRQR